FDTFGFKHEQVISRLAPSSDGFPCVLKGADDFDQAYVISCEVSVSRGVEDFSFPSHCSRGERRKLHSLAKTALEQLGQELPGKLYSIDELSHESEDRKVVMESPPASLMKIGVARDWPDARALWLSKDGSLAVWVNMEDHLKLVSYRSDACLQEAFKTICINLLKLETLYKKLRHPFIWKNHLGWVMSSPAEVGTGLKASITLRLLNLAENKRLDDVLDRLRLQIEATNYPGIYKVSNLQTIGIPEVALTQLVVDGVKLLIRMEKRLENNGGIDDLFPAQK
ncbi:hypothetical protein DNTS_024058, partial [Danionella cerebrum]